ncbi:hypothetical protein QYE76_050311 [Lolium multiflorum]|uniref:Reverse transcriptase domain-containing protein n=1 Tax=Lolium multiflorum TaxID=4521 RepID=A0AAD8WGV0_LOLMU|nr:hypothetical protein QYE76_050311 [Lolium multiflorum]
MAEFREMLSFCNLFDLGYSGLPWTYDNNQDGLKNVRVRLDRVVACPGWTNTFPDFSVKHLSFFKTGIMPEGVNNSTIVLIPKTKNPSELKDFRPISLCNVLYKIIAKCIINRLRPCLSDIVSPEQSAFIKGRQIADNALVAFECFHTIQHSRDKKGTFCAYKLDLSKAYDRVDWTFLEAALVKLGFDNHWITRVMACVKSVRYSLRMNEVLQQTFSPSRGLRQGDPLSSFLFLFVAEGFSSCFKKEIECGRLHELKITRNAPGISHLLFADDSLIFFEATAQQATVIKETLDKYEKACFIENYYNTTMQLNDGMPTPDRKGKCLLIPVAASRNEKDRRTTTQKWTKPPLGWAKINTDASFISANGTAHWGAIVRDEQGNTISSAWSPIPRCATVEEAEAIAVLEGLRLTSTVDTPCCLETDCKSVTDAWNWDTIKRSQAGIVINEAKHAALSFQNLKIEFIPRSANGAAHRLAAFSRSTGCNGILFERLRIPTTWVYFGFSLEAEAFFDSVLFGLPWSAVGLQSLFSVVSRFSSAQLPMTPTSLRPTVMEMMLTMLAVVPSWLQDGLFVLLYAPPQSLGAEVSGEEKQSSGPVMLSSKAGCRSR